MEQTTPEVTLDNCDKEPIHILGRIQSHGFLMVCRSTDFQIVQVSENAADYTSMSVESLLESTFSSLFNDDISQKLHNAVEEGLQKADTVWTLLIPDVQVNGQSQYWNLIAHTAHDIAPDLLLLEFEPIADDAAVQQYYQWPDQILQLALSSVSVEDIFDRCAVQIKEFTGFDRVMVYRFGKDWHGEVIAEAKNEELEPYLGLHYPASDIPAQARKLYVRNLVRIIADVGSETSVVTPAITPREHGDQSPLNLSDSVLRAVSPIHIEYLQNMGVQASMSISILNSGELWGLFACHHYAPKFVDYSLRSICKFISTILSGFLETKLVLFDSDYLTRLTGINEVLMKQMVVADHWTQGLTDSATTILQAVNCSGAAICLGNDVHLLGKTPSDAQVRLLVDWLNEQYQEGLFVTNQLSQIVHSPAAHPLVTEGSPTESTSTLTTENEHIAESLTDSISDIAGLLAIQLLPDSNDSILWFRPEVLQTVKWAGKPTKEMTITDDVVHLSPRKSFEVWSQTVEGQSEHWKLEEVEAVRRLAANVQSVIVSHTMKVEQINKELVQANKELDAFSYTVAHDLRSPLRHIESYSEILYEEYRDQLDDDALGILETVLHSTSRMKQLVNDLLAYSRIGRTEAIYNRFDPRPLIDEILKSLIDAKLEKTVVVRIDALPQLYGDQPMLRQVFTNILDNAVKYSSHESEPTIEIGGSADDEFTTIYVKDNGVGFDMEYVDKAYNVFGRLHTDDEFEGTGIGLAIVARIASTHNGRSWIESAPNIGTTIYFSIPTYSGLE